jgi:hypothetical protein
LGAPADEAPLRASCCSQLVRDARPRGTNLFTFSLSVQTAPPYSQSGGTIKRCGSDQPATCPCRSESRPPGAQHRCTPTIPHHSPFAVLFHSLFAIRYSPCFTARRSLLAVSHHSPFAIRCLSPFAICRNFPLAARSSPRAWVSTNGGSPTHPRTVRARHAVPLPFAYTRVGVHERPGPSWRADGLPARFRRHNTTGAGLGPAPTSTNTIRHSRFAIRHPPYFSIRHSLSFTIHRSPLAARCSPSFTIRDSRFAIRCLSPSATRHSPLATRHSLLATPYALLAVFLHSNSLSAPSQASPIRSRLSPAQAVVAGSKRERLRALDKHAVLPVQSASII